MTASDGTQAVENVERESICGCMCPDCRGPQCCEGIYCSTGGLGLERELP